MEADVHQDVKVVEPASTRSSDVLYFSDLNCPEKSVFVRHLMFKSPETTKGSVVDVFSDCCIGDCRCSHILAGNALQIKPCRVASVMFSNGFECSADEWKLFCGLTVGFDVVDNENFPEYDCYNYNSILEPEYKKKMDSIISSELENGMLSEVCEKPHCIHALAAVPKPDGGMRPITDCSRPDGENVNSNMSSLVDLKFISNLNQ